MLNLLAEDGGAGSVLPKGCEPILVVVHGLLCQKVPCYPLDSTLGAMAKPVLCCLGLRSVIWEPTLGRQHVHKESGEALQWGDRAGLCRALRQGSSAHVEKLL